MASMARQFANFIITLEPAAFGCTAVMSPDLPMPWPSLRKYDGIKEKKNVKLYKKALE